MNHKRKKARIRSRRGSSHTPCPNGTPAYWNQLYHSRPRRQRNKLGCHKTLLGEDTDATVWDLGNRRPHKYYW